MLEFFRGDSVAETMTRRGTTHGKCPVRRDGMSNKRRTNGSGNNRNSSRRTKGSR